MSTYLYCVLAPPKGEALPSGLTGIGGSPVRVLVSRKSNLEAWVATVDDAVLRVTGRALAEQALLHNDVVAAAMATGRSPAPSRFGFCFADDATCIAELDRRASELHDVLSRIAGAVEMSVLLIPTTASAPPSARPRRDEPSAGRRYLEVLRERRLSEERRRANADTLAADLTSAVGGLVRGESHSLNASGVVSIAHLVGREDVERYRRALTTVAPDNGFRIVVAGPRAPYSFAATSATEVGHDSSSPSRDE